MTVLTPLLKPADVARVLGVSIKGVHAECNAGRLEYVKVNGKERRFTEEMVRRYVEAQTVSKIVVDRKRTRTVTYPLKGGVAKSVEDSGTNLTKEIRSLCQ